MLVKDLLGRESPLSSTDEKILIDHCSEFIKESDGLPLFKSLPNTYNLFQRVKVRQQKKNNDLAEAYNSAFSNAFYKLRQRAVFAYTTQLSQFNENMESFYVFPVNGYKFLYSKEVSNSSSDYQRVIDTLFEQFNDNDKAIEIVTDLLKYTYVSKNLQEGILSGAEIILYNIPQYYTVRVSACKNYAKLLSPVSKI